MRVDLLHLSRTFRRSPASAGAAILTLSLTLGAGGSMFALVHAVLLTPPPFEDPDALVTVGEVPIAEPTAVPRRATYATFEAWRQRAGSLAVLEAFEGTNLTLTGLGAAERLSVNDVTLGFLPLLGIAPALGRMFDPGDVGRPVVILSDAFWRGRLSADPAVIGRGVVLGGQPHTIVGVLPAQFLFELNPSEVWRPLSLTPAQAVRADYQVGVVARVAPNVSPATLAAALADVSRASLPPARTVAIPVKTAISGDASRTLGVLGGAAALAMVIAFTNLAGLLIVRSIGRRRELAIRSALGAGRSEIAKQLLLEAQALVAIGTIGGVVLAFWLTPSLARLALEQFGGVANREVRVSWQVIAVVAAAASACGWICAWLPAIAAARRTIPDTLHRGDTPPPRELGVRRLLVTGQIALAFVLLACVALLGGSLVQLLNVDRGFDDRGVLTLQVSVPAASYRAERVVSFYSALQSGLEERLGPRSAAIINEIPLSGSTGRNLVRVPPGDVRGEAVVREAGPAYFDVMRIPVLAGRAFQPHDNASAPPRVVISRSLADHLFASERPIGRHISTGTDAQTAEIIGVVGDVKHRALDGAYLPTLYVSALQSPSRSSIVVIRSARPAADVIAAVREEVARLDSSLPVYRVRSMEDVVAASPGVPARRVLTATFMGFALLALVLSAIGLFGVIAHDVAARRTELALRIALGADSRRILSATFRQGALVMGSGLAVGAVLSIWAAQALDGVGFTAGQPNLPSALVAGAVLLVTGVAAILPAAMSASRTDPLLALRGQ